MWFYRLFGEEFGPVDLESIRELLQTEQLGETDEVRQESGPWKQALTFTELGFGAAQTATATAAWPSSTSWSTSKSDSNSQVAAADEWYVLSLGLELGPMPFDEVIQKVTSGEISGDDQVRLGQTAKWRAVRSMGRLAAAIPFEKVEKKLERSPAKTTSSPTIATVDVRNQTPAGTMPVVGGPAGTPAFGMPQVGGMQAPYGGPQQPQYGAGGYGAPVAYQPAPYPAPNPYGQPMYGTAPYPPNPYQQPGYPQPGYPMAAPAPYQPAPQPVDQWYGWIGGSEYGPVDFATLQQWGTTGQLATNDYVRQGQTADWQLASDVPGLVAAAAPVAVAAPAVPAKGAEWSTFSKPAEAAKPAETPKPIEAVKPAEAPKPVEVAKVEPVEPKTTEPVTAPVSDAPKPASGFGGAGAGGMGGSTKSTYKGPPPKGKTKKGGGGGGGFDLGPIIEIAKMPVVWAVAAVVLLIVGLFFLPESTGKDIETYNRLVEVLVEVRKMRASGGANWETYASGVEKELAPTMKELKATASRERPHKQYLLWAGSQRLPEVFKKSKTAKSPAEKDYEKLLKDFAARMRVPPPPEGPKEEVVEEPKGKGKSKSSPKPKAKKT